MTSRTFSQDSEDTWELLWVVLNYVTCIPVLLLVGGLRYLVLIFLVEGKLTDDSVYHFYCISGNTTTIESWEKDKVATLIRRGKIRDVKFPYVRILPFNPVPFLIVVGGTESWC